VPLAAESARLIALTLLTYGAKSDGIRLRIELAPHRLNRDHRRVLRERRLGETAF
jgi:hypothetical protein